LERNEYREKYNRLKSLLDANKQQEAIEIVEGTNWNKCNNVNAIVLAAEVYENAGRYEEARELLYLAHERSPIGRTIIYHLALDCIQLGDMAEAKDFYDEFVEIAPHDSLKYILKYKLSKAQGAENTTLIAILEELKEHDFLEEWSYELAYLYHKTLQIDKCIDLCDEIILWFGDGPYVERALEMKMIYQPLDKMQEDKYRSFQNKRDGITEIKANELLSSGEIVSKNIAIPSVEIQAERFNTINLQAEIKKNIDEIMKATEAGAVNENMENIKTLVEEIPYLQVSEEPEEKPVVKEQHNTESLMDTFKGYLAEEYDGQMSLLVPEPKEIEEQIEGQMTIEDVMAEWEKTKRAAEATLQDAEKKELEEAKDQALREANQIMDRLEDAMPRLEAGVSPNELLKEKYMSKSEDPQELEPASTAPVNMDDYIPSIEEIEYENHLSQESDEPEPEQKFDEPVEDATNKHMDVFNIPKVAAAGAAAGAVAGVGLAVPVIHGADAAEAAVDLAEKLADKPAVEKSVNLGDTRRWEPPHIDIDSKSPEENEISKGLKEEIQEIAHEAVHKDMIEPGETTVHDVTEEDDQVNIEEASKIVAGVNDMLQQEIDRIMAEDAAREQEVLTDDMTPVAEPLQEIEEEPVAEESISEDEVELDLAAEVQEMLEEEESIAEVEEPTAQEADDLPTIIDPEELLKEETDESEEEVLPEIAEVELEPEEVAELVDEKVLEKAIATEMPQMELTEDEQEIFSYFMPISGMKNTICQALTGAKSHIETRKNSATGNIIIQGITGSGKTMLASNLIKVLQNETGKLMGPAGKIDAEQLNKKDIAAVMSKVEGGSLIIEHASKLTEASMETLRQQMSLSSTHVLVVLEAEKDQVEKKLAKNTKFASMFTEKITIPIFTIDELVNFGKVYALENGYAVDEMAILAMYNRINLIQHLGRPTSLIEVRDIMENAISKAERGGIKAAFGRLGSKRYDEDGNLILREKDFDLN
jgi:tetratricopeptide (TPR) repeat protein